MLVGRLQMPNTDLLPTTHADDYHNCSYLGHVPRRVIPSELCGASGSVTCGEWRFAEPEEGLYSAELSCPGLDIAADSGPRTMCFFRHREFPEFRSAASRRPARKGLRNQILEIRYKIELGQFVYDRHPKQGTATARIHHISSSSPSSLLITFRLCRRNICARWLLL